MPGVEVSSPSGSSPAWARVADETIIDTFAQANDEGVTPLARLGYPGEHAVWCRFLVFNQDLVEPIERQAGQDRDHPAGASHVGPRGTAHDARQVGDPVLVLESDQLVVRHGRER